MSCLLDASAACTLSRVGHFSKGKVPTRWSARWRPSWENGLALGSLERILKNGISSRVKDGGRAGSEVSRASALGMVARGGWKRADMRAGLVFDFSCYGIPHKLFGQKSLGQRPWYQLCLFKESWYVTK
jgi:hypothetical protein